MTAILLVLGTFAIATVVNLVSAEAQGWLNYLPRAILRLASWRLDPEQRVSIYEEEWLPDLIHHLQAAEGRPITSLCLGTKYALGLLVSAHRIAAIKVREEPAQVPPPAQASPQLDKRATELLREELGFRLGRGGLELRPE